MFALLMTLIAMSFAQSPATQPRTELWIWTDASCPPCRRFGEDYTSVPGFADALQHYAYVGERRPWSRPADTALAAKYGVTTVPAFSLHRDGRMLRIVRGYRGPQELLDDLRIPATLIRDPGREGLPSGSPGPDVAGSNATPSSDTPPGELDVLRMSLSTTQERLRAAEERAEDAARRASEELAARESATREANARIADAERIASQRIAAAESACEAAAQRAAADAHANAAREATASQVAPDTPDDAPLRGLARWAILTFAAPHIGIPAAGLTGALSVVGWIAARRRRRRSAQAGFREPGTPFADQDTARPLPRDLDEAFALLELSAKSDGRAPVHQALFGALAQQAIDEETQQDPASPLADFGRRLKDRFNEIAPISLRQ